QARLDAGAGDLRSLPRALPADHDDDDGGAPGRPATGDSHGTGIGTAPAAWHDHRGRAARLAAAHALHDAGDLSAAGQAASAAVGRPRSSRTRSFVGNGNARLSDIARSAVSAEARRGDLE